MITKKKAFLSQVAIYDGLVAKYLFEGDGVDAWLNRPLTLYGTATFNGVGYNSSKAYSNAGTVGYAQTSSALPQSNTLSWSFWVNISALPTTGNLFFIVSTAQLRASNLSIRVDSTGLLQAQIEYIGDTGVVNIGGIQAGVWYHIGVTVDASKVIRTYINGAITNTFNLPTGWMSTASNLIVGKYITTTNSYCMNGKVDRLSIYNRALSTLEIYKLYTLEV